jgi:antitoxin FitA
MTSAVLTIRNLEPSIRDELRVDAARNGRSMEAQVREMRQRYGQRDQASPGSSTKPAASDLGFGSRIAALFADIGPRDELLEFPRLGGKPRPANFD